MNPHIYQQSDNSGAMANADDSGAALNSNVPATPDATNNSQNTGVAPGAMNNAPAPGVLPPPATAGNTNELMMLGRAEMGVRCEMLAQNFRRNYEQRENILDTLMGIAMNHGLEDARTVACDTVRGLRDVLNQQNIIQITNSLFANNQSDNPLTLAATYQAFGLLASLLRTEDTTKIIQTLMTAIEQPTTPENQSILLAWRTACLALSRLNEFLRQEQRSRAIEVLLTPRQLPSGDTCKWIHKIQVYYTIGKLSRNALPEECRRIQTVLTGATTDDDDTVRRTALKALGELSHSYREEEWFGTNSNNQQSGPTSNDA